MILMTTARTMASRVERFTLKRYPNYPREASLRFMCTFARESVELPEHPGLTVLLLCPKISVRPWVVGLALADIAGKGIAPC